MVVSYGYRSGITWPMYSPTTFKYFKVRSALHVYIGLIYLGKQNKSAFKFAHTWPLMATQHYRILSAASVINTIRVKPSLFLPSQVNNNMAWVFNCVTSFISVKKLDSRFAPSQWETALLCNDVSHWLCTSLESTVSKPDYWLRRPHTSRPIAQ